MIAQSTRISLVLLVLIAVGVIGDYGPVSSTAMAQQQGENKSWTGSITSGFKEGVDKLGRIGKSDDKKKHYSSKDDPISLSNKSKPSPKLHVAVARLHEESGNADNAAKQYLAALKLDPDYLPALLGYARLLDQLGQTDAAIQLYQRAAKTHPKEAAPACNNMGLCFAHAGRIDEAIAVMTEGVRLAPKNPLYRNNIAAILVEQNRYREAYGHLRAVHNKAAAYYNMGYLLTKNGSTQEAMQHFAWALKADPTMTSAKQWLYYLQKETLLARRPERPTTDNRQTTRSTEVAPPQYATPPVQRRESAPMPPDRPTTRRLPPTDTRTMPNAYNRRQAAPEAPLPPSSNTPVIRPLPRVN